MSDLTKDSTPEEVRAAWKEDLRSGKFKQGRNRLAQPAITGDNGSPPLYCCLGVLCERAVQAGLVERDGPFAYRSPGVPGTYTATLPRVVQEWAGLTNSEGALTHGIAYGPPHESTSARALSVLNDDAGYTFEQIADVIEDGGVETRG